LRFTGGRADDRRTMKFVTNHGRVERSMQWVCPACKNDVLCSLVFVQGGLPVPKDLPLHCPGCYAFVALINPTERGLEEAAAALGVPPDAGVPEPVELLDDEPSMEKELVTDIERIESNPDQGERPDGTPITGTPPPPIP
jgi:hypothetical protein